MFAKNWFTKKVVWEQVASIFIVLILLFENYIIGIIGNPDSGKKSISNALFRLVELSQGRICVGGMNISEIPLDILRSRIGIVPQEPLLFKGTIR